MSWLALLNVLAHHGEAADPDLLEWIKGVLDHLLAGGPWVVVALLGLLILAMPAGIAMAYLRQQRHRHPDHHSNHRHARAKAGPGQSCQP